MLVAWDATTSTSLPQLNRFSNIVRLPLSIRFAVEEKLLVGECALLQEIVPTLFPRRKALRIQIVGDRFVLADRKACKTVREKTTIGWSIFYSLQPGRLAQKRFFLTQPNMVDAETWKNTIPDWMQLLRRLSWKEQTTGFHQNTRTRHNLSLTIRNSEFAQYVAVIAR